MRSVAPISSQITPTLLIRDISLTPSMLMIVVMQIRMPPSSSAFCAPPLVIVAPASAEVPKNWSLVVTAGSTTCQSIATAVIVTIAPTM